ncbi:unnamed protein product [Sphenostylis stenocarpa]|uniref:Uncharacterized protein n=1 Tax=Sphenostylis stenocarpa TaxID=92480 RepID=A0AA86W6H2_9FABA|nr:unnamed protein product [Sphenostylis stenocarpa]
MAQEVKGDVWKEMKVRDIIFLAMAMGLGSHFLEFQRQNKERGGRREVEYVDYKLFER